jgi:hypothetical protein
MDVNCLVDLLLLSIRELDGPLEDMFVETSKWYACYYPREMLIACAYVMNLR